MTTVLNHLDAAVDAVLARVSGPIVLGLPLGIGKPNPFVNRLYERMKADPSRPLTIITALSLEVPTGKSEIEQHFLAPLVERVFRDYPDLTYVKDLRAGTLPTHIQVREFFLKTGDYLANALAQQQYISTNYTFVARDMLGQGLNVIAQAVASEGEAWRLSLSSNPDVILELVERFAETGQPLLKVGVVNRQMPFMPNGAEVAPDFFDLVVTDPAATHTLFAPPNAKVSTADYAIGLHASSLVPDGGTLQIGIGSLGDAIAQGLIVREQRGAEYRQLMAALCPEGLDGRELGRFETGLYGCSEMFVNGFLRLMEAGIVRREVYADATLQALVNEGRIDPAAPGEAALQALRDEGRISDPPTPEDRAFLAHHGLWPVGGPLRGGHCMTGGFFLGPTDFYEHLRRMPPAQKARINMTRIDFINQLYGRDAHETELKRLQRRRARFMNTTMKVTLLGAAASDALESGAVVSGVGGQYNFVAMAHALPDARSILMLRATHETKDGPVSNLLFSYGHTTIPRHLRDIVITEYGVADLRAQSDHEVVKRLIRIADSRFQRQLVAEAQAHGKLEADWQLPEAWTHNTPEALDAVLHPWQSSGLLPGFPFGTDLNEDELKMVAALRRLKKATQHPVDLVTMALKALWEGKEAPPAYLQRLGLDEAQGVKGLLLKRLFAGNL